MTFRRFYLGMNYNEGGIEIAKILAPKLELLTGDECTSRWIHSEAHESHEFRLTIGTTDLADIARSDYILLAPLTGTSRGLHVEMGLALGLDKPVYLYRPDYFDGVGFDALCLPWKPAWIRALKEGMTRTMIARRSRPKPSSEFQRKPTGGSQ